MLNKILYPIRRAYICAYVIVALTMFSSNTIAQNMVPNGNFEQYSACPSNFSQVLFCSGWRQYHTGTPDFFHTCNTGSFVNPLSNAFGTQTPASGSGYVGLGTYNHNNTPYREYIARQITPLQPGALYEVSLSASLADSSQWATNDLGVWFYDVGATTTLTTGMSVPAVAQVSYTGNGYITNKTGWVRLIANYMADSFYDNMVVGGFIPTSSLTPIPVSGGTSNPNNSYAYYYIDSVVVRRINFFNFIFKDTSLCVGDTIIVPYTVFEPGRYLPGNVFTLQLSGPSGSFATPTNLASITSTSSGVIKAVIPSSVVSGTGYKLRMISTNAADVALGLYNINIRIETSVPMPIASSNSPVCAGDSIKLSATSITPVLKYTWNGPSLTNSIGQNKSISDATLADAGDYIVRADYYGCTAYDTVRVTVYQLPMGTAASSNSPICEGETLLLNASSTTPGVSFNWQGPSGFSATTANTSIPATTLANNGKFIITYSINGCSKKDTLDIIIKNNPAPISFSSNAPLCEGESLNISLQNTIAGTVYTWKGPDSFTSSVQNVVINPAAVNNSGVYTVTTTLANGCSLTDSISIIVNPSPPKPVLSANTPLCAGDTLFLNTTNTISSATYTWQGPGSFSFSGTSTFIPNVATTNSGTYIITATIGNCSAGDTIITDIKSYSLSLGNNKLLCNSETVILTTDIPNATYTWQDGTTEKSYTVSKQGIYHVQVQTDYCGILSDTVEVNYRSCECNPRIPTAFSPNADGRNDKFAPVLDCTPSKYLLIIANRFGEIVFQSDNHTIKWDGNYKGQPAEIGTYFYVLKLTDIKMQATLHKGDLTLIR